ncbi:MAG: hypothetical protein HYX60_09505 [Legionella longbeachae]|nr:hypothetical protein [Legionella longbeachae]
MNAHEFDDDENEMEEISAPDTVVTIEVNPSTKLERRRRIEDLFEEKRLKEEFAEFG